MSIAEGIYIISNMTTESTLDLSGADQKTIIGFPHHGMENQQWEFLPLGAGWAIRSVHTGGYMTSNLDTPDFRYIPVVASGGFPVAWMVQVIEELEEKEFIVRIHWPNGNLAIELPGVNPVPGTKINLFATDQSAKHQRWKLKSCERLPRPSEAINKIAPKKGEGVWTRVKTDGDGQAQPVVNETVIINNHNDGSGHTTTTTITTTVTVHSSTTKT